jgi:predicted transcriptional regulator
VYDRLSKSILKAAVLLAATKGQHGTVVVELEDLLLAMKYGQGWRNYAAEVINGIGRSASEVEMQRILKAIRKKPGIARSQLMQWFHLEARHADQIFATLEQRGLVIGNRDGRTVRYEAIGRIQINDNKESSRSS